MQQHPRRNWLTEDGRRLGRRVGGLVLGWWLIVAPLWAASSLDHAQQAQALIGEERWSQVIRIENLNRANVYPREVFALVFELGGLLWFYTDTDGTQSLSLRANELGKEKKELGRLLRAIDPGFSRYEIVASRTRAEASKRKSLPNGCLIESYAQLRARLAAGESIANARLLSVYYRANGARTGHTLLAYETPDGTYVFDPNRPAFDRRMSGTLAADPLAVGRALRLPFAVTDARWVPTSMPQVRRAIALGSGLDGGARRTVCDS